MADNSRSPAPRVALVLGAATAVDICTVLLGALVGVVGPVLLRSNGLHPWLLGAAIVSFYFAGAAAAGTLGRRLESLGAARVATAAAVCSSSALAACALGGHVPVILLATSAASGAAFGVALPSTNAVVTSFAPTGQIVALMCIKQTAIPVGLMGAAWVGAWAMRYSWRWPFATAAALSLMSAVLFWGVLRWTGPGVTRPRPPATRPAGPSGAGLRDVGIVTLLASFLPGALTGYAFVALVDVGLPLGRVVLLLTLANLLGIAVRIISGLTVQLRPGVIDVVIAGMMLAGGTGALLLATGTVGASTVGLLMAFTFGWGWSGLMFASAIRKRPGQPASAGAIVQSGGMFGSAAGPLVMALSSEARGAHAGWLSIGGLALAAGFLLAWRSFRAAGLPG